MDSSLCIEEENRAYPTTFIVSSSFYNLRLYIFKILCTLYKAFTLYTKKSYFYSLKENVLRV